MLFGNRYGSYRSNSDNMLSSLILLILVSFLAYYAYTHYIIKFEEQSALTDADEKSINAMVKKYESELRAKHLKNQADKLDTDGVCSDNTLKNKYDCINKKRCSIPEIVDEDACIKTAGAKWYPNEWTANVESSSTNADSTDTSASSNTVTNNDNTGDTNTITADTSVTDDSGNSAGDTSAGSEGFLTSASELLDEPFMAYTSSSSLVGADLTENFMPFSELN